MSKNPFIVEDNVDGTANLVDCVLSYLAQASFGMCISHESNIPNESNYFVGQEVIIRGVREAVEYIAKEAERTELEANVSRIKEES